MFKDDEIEITAYRSGGPGGQKRNKTESAVRVRHVPTGIVVVSTESRSQHRNKDLALEELARRLALRNRRRRKRVATRPGRAAIERRLTEKRQIGQKKDLRRKPEED